jgi:hypothetical protein
MSVDYLENKLSRICKILLRDINTLFTFSGDEYFCTQIGNIFHINFASPPETLTPEYEELLEGYTDHEAAHGLFTNFKYIKRRMKELQFDPNQEKIFKVFSALEDFRIEKRMRSKYAGSGANLDRTNTFLIKQLESFDFAGWDEVCISLEFILNRWEMIPKVERMSEYLNLTIPELLKEASAAKSTKKAMEVAEKIVEIIQGSAPCTTEEPPKPKKKSETSDLISFLNGETVLDSVKNWKEGILEKENKRLREVSGSPNLPKPFTRVYDTYTKVNTTSAQEYSTDLDASFYAIKMRNLILNETNTADKTGERRGKICNKSLYRVRTDDKIFKRKGGVRKELDSVFCIGVDNSFSMNTEESFSVLTSVFEVLGHLNAPFQVFTYTTHKEPLEEIYREFVKSPNKDLFTRVLPVKFEILKDFDEFYSNRKRFLNLGGERNFTPTPEAYEYAIHMLKNRSEQNKVFINITDGVPETAFKGKETLYKLVKNQMKEAARNNVKCVNIGYKSSSKKFREIDPDVIVTTKKKFLETFVRTVHKKIVPTYNAF